MLKSFLIVQNPALAYIFALQNKNKKMKNKYTAITLFNNGAHNLYVLSNDEIKENDWCLNSFNNLSIKKIVATTDVSIGLIAKKISDEVVQNIGSLLIKSLSNEKEFDETWLLENEPKLNESIYTKKDLILSFNAGMKYAYTDISDFNDFFKTLKK